MEIEDEEIFWDYIETTVPVSRALVLFVVGIIILFLFLPVIGLSIRSSEKVDDDDGNDKGDGINEISFVDKNPLAKKTLDEGESTPLLSNLNDPEDKIVYDGNSTGPERRPENKKRINATITIPKRILSTVSHNVSPRKLSGGDKDLRAPSFLREEEIEDDEEGICNAVKFSDPTTSAFEKLQIVTCHNFDSQTKAMIGLGFPYLIQAMISAASEIIQMAIVGHQLGTAKLSAWVVIDLAVKLTSDAVGSVITSGNIMISQIAEAEDENSSRRIGIYLQLSILFYVVGMVPIVIFWSCFTKDVLLFLKLDPDIAEDGQEYVKVYIISILLGDIVSCFQYTLDVVGFEVQSTICTFLGEVAIVLGVAVALFGDTPFDEMHLVDLGWVYVFVTVFYLVGILAAIYGNGWLEDYYEGFFSSPFLIFKTRTTSNSNNDEDVVSGKAVKLLLYNTFQLTLNDILFNGEWQILIFFASSLGPAEVAAWGVLGVIWEELEYIVTAIAEGCEVRVAMTLGSGHIKNAKLISYKAIWICFAWGILVSIVFFLFEGNVSTFITKDPLLQEMVAYNLPMISLVNIISGIGIMAEHILWSQNRAPLSTVICAGTSCLVTLPLAALSSCLFNFNLIGQTASVAIGASVFSALSVYFVVSSDWKTISEDVVALHVSDDSGSDDDGKCDV